MTSAFASYDTSYEQRTPYISTTEYSNAPTSLDVSNLIAGGDSQAQLVALQETIGRASSWVDEYCCGAWGTLAATQNTENARVWGSRNGTLAVHPKYWPILSVDAFSYSAIGFGFPNFSASINPSGSIWIEPQEFIVQPQGVVGGFGLSAPVGIGTFQYFCQWVYTNGWPNTYLAASVSAGSASIAPVSLTGIYPGTQLTIYDLPRDEPIQVAASYVPGAAVVPLTTQLQYNHATTATITNLPPSIKQAAILATTGFIKQRGSGALIAANIGEVTRTDTGYSQASGSDWNQAKMLLNPFRMVYVGY